MKPQSMRATVTASPHAEGPKDKSANKSFARGATSHKRRARRSWPSRIADHLLQKRSSFSQCPAVNIGTSAASGEIARVQGFSRVRDLTMLKTSAVSFL